MKAYSVNHWLQQERTEMEQLINIITRLEKPLKEQRSPALGVTIGVSFNDGD